ncbi:MAG: hypothetical protein AAF413_03435 [Patescibacteria group bacterium]
MNKSVLLSHLAAIMAGFGSALLLIVDSTMANVFGVILVIAGAAALGASFGLRSGSSKSQPTEE